MYKHNILKCLVELNMNQNQLKDCESEYKSSHMRHNNQMIMNQDLMILGGNLFNDLFLPGNWKNNCRSNLWTRNTTV